MNTEIGYQKLKEHYPNCITEGTILGDALAIVGEYGLTICFENQDRTQSRFYFKKGEELPINRFTDKMLLITPDGFVWPIPISYEKFTGFSFKNKLFI